MRRTNVCLWVLVTVALLAGGRVWAENSRFDELAGRYARKAEGREAARALHEELRHEPHQRTPYGLWMSLFTHELSPRRKAVNAIALIDALYPEGDPARWTEVSGFLRPSFVPAPLAAADGVYLGVLSLLRLGEQGADALALDLMERFMNSSRAKFTFITTGPAEYGFIVEEMERRGLTPVFGRWPEGVRTVGSLPFARPVRGTVRRGRAIDEGMTSLNGAGQPASNGIYAWDRRYGRIYDVVEGRRWVFFPWND